MNFQMSPTTTGETKTGIMKGRRNHAKRAVPRVEQQGEEEAEGELDADAQGHVERSDPDRIPELGVPEDVGVGVGAEEDAWQGGKDRPLVKADPHHVDERVDGEEEQHQEGRRHEKERIRPAPYPLQ